MRFFLFQTALRKTIWKYFSLLIWYCQCTLWSCGNNMEPPSWSDMSRMIHMYLLMTNKHLTHSAAVSWPVIPWLFYNNSCSEAFHKIYAVVLRGQCWDYILIQTVDIHAGYYLTRHKSKLLCLERKLERERVKYHIKAYCILAKFLT